MLYKISRKIRTQYWNYKIIKCHPGLHNDLCNFHAFQYSTVRASKYDTVTLTPQQKGLRTGGIPQTWGQPKRLLAVILHVIRAVTEAPHWCTVSMNRPLETFFFFFFAALQFCHTGLFCNGIPLKSCKNCWELAVNKSPHYPWAPGNSTWNQLKVLAVTCFCNQEDVTVDTFFDQKVNYLTSSWWDHQIDFSK